MRAFLRRMNGWQRIGLVLTGFWIIVSSSAYFSNLGIWGIAHSGWLIAWVAVAPFSQFLFPYNFETIPPSCDPFSDSFCPTFYQFRFVGLVYFMLGPVVALWIVGYAVFWIRHGFPRK